MKDLNRELYLELIGEEAIQEMIKAGLIEIKNEKVFPTELGLKTKNWMQYIDNQKLN